jgi:FkbM family methyltransferase
MGIYKALTKWIIPKSLKNWILEFLRARIYQKQTPNSFSQCGEDRIIRFLFERLNKKVTSYVDVGAYHPIHSNNTYLFYINGARGVCVEPNEKMAHEIGQIRTEDITLNVGISPAKSGPLKYYEFTDPQLNTFEEKEALKRYDGDAEKLIQVREVTVLTIYAILEKYFSEQIDLLSIDVEGLDVAVLKSLVPYSFRPACICVESLAFESNSLRKKTDGLTETMTSLGYEIYADTFVNTIYLRKELFQQLTF